MVGAETRWKPTLELVTEGTAGTVDGQAAEGVQPARAVQGAWALLGRVGRGELRRHSPVVRESAGTEA